jgi:hypothetical protein
MATQDERPTWRRDMWAAWIAVSAIPAAKLVRRGPVGAVAAAALLLLPAWLGRVIAQTRREIEQVPVAEPPERHEWEQGIRRRLDDASEIAQSNLGSPATRRDLRDAISDVRTALRSADGGGLGDEMDRIATLLDRLVTESIAARERDRAAEDLRDAIEALDTHPDPPEELRLLE